MRIRRFASLALGLWASAVVAGPAPKTSGPAPPTAGPLCFDFPIPKPGEPSASGLSVDSILFSGDGHTLLTTSKLETRARRWNWDPQVGKVYAAGAFTTKPGADTLLALTGNGTHAFALGTNTLDQNLTVYDTDDEKRVHRFKDGLTAPGGFGIISSQVVITPDGSRLLSSHENGQILLWDNAHAKGAETDVPIAILTQENPGAIALSPDGEHALVVGNPKHSLLLWDLRNPKKPTPTVILNSYPDAITDIVFSSDGQSAAFRDSRGQVQFWSLQAPEKIHALDWKPSDAAAPPALGLGFGLDRVGQGRLAFSPDGSQIAAIDPESHVAFWDTRTIKLQRLAEPANAHSLAFSPDGSTLVVGGVDNLCLHRITPFSLLGQTSEPSAHREPPAPEAQDGLTPEAQNNHH